MEVCVGQCSEKAPLGEQMRPPVQRERPGFLLVCFEGKGNIEI